LNLFKSGIAAGIRPFVEKPKELWASGLKRELSEKLWEEVDGYEKQSIEKPMIGLPGGTMCLGAGKPLTGSNTNTSNLKGDYSNDRTS